MNSDDSPRPYPLWRKNATDREEDAARTFGYYLIRHCRDAALAGLENAAQPADSVAQEAVDTALHNVCDLLEGFWPLEAGREHGIQLVLSVRVTDQDGKPIETLELSPSKLDLPIAYWLWARERKFT